MPNPTYDLIQSITQTTGVITISFTGIPATYTDIRIMAVTDDLDPSAYGDTRIRFNGDTGNNYGFVAPYAYGGTTYPHASRYFYGQPWTWITQNLMERGTTIVGDIFDYSDTSIYKQMNWFAGEYQANSTTGQFGMWGTAVWNGYAAITSIDFITASGSPRLKGVYSLYGIKKEA
jgi:hypothetical protein